MTPPPKIEPGDPDGDYPLNHQDSANFNVGGVNRILPPAQQLEQLVSYLDAAYPRPDFTPPWKGGEGDPGPADRYVALLPDRITQAAMMMLGTAADHTMPGVAFAGDVEVSEAPGGVVFTPSSPTGRWAVSLHSGGWWRGSGDALEHQWRPEVAAAAELSGTTILDLDHPLAPTHTVAEISESVAEAIAWVRAQDADSIAAWGYSSGAALAALQSGLVDALVLTYPDLASLDGLPEEIRADAVLPEPPAWPAKTLVQIATEDEIAARPGTGDAQVAEYLSQHRISTPDVARQRIRDTAEFLRSV